MYFRAFKDKSKKETVEISNGALLRRCRNQTTEIKKVKSKESGMGVVEVLVTKEDKQNNCQFILQVAYDKFTRKEYQLFDLKEESFSPVFISFGSSRVCKPQKLKIKAQYSDIDQFLLVVRQYKQIYLQHLVKRENDLKNNEEEITLDLNLLPNSGVYTLQVYRPLTIEEKKKATGDDNQWGFAFDGELI